LNGLQLNFFEKPENPDGEFNVVKIINIEYAGDNTRNGGKLL
jgi:hypothetical protein